MARSARPQNDFFSLTSISLLSECGSFNSLEKTLMGMWACGNWNQDVLK